MKVCVVGLGYIGLPTAALLAAAHHEVFGFDTDDERRAELAHIGAVGSERPVRDLVNAVLSNRRLQVCDRIVAAQAYIICVPTPAKEREPDLSYVEGAANMVAQSAQPGAMIILESTVPPGTTERVIGAALRAAGKNPDHFRIAHAPERVVPGAILQELRGNARVIGGRTPGDAQAVAALYGTFCRGEITLCSCNTAEFVKVVENTYRDINIAFANELSVLAEELGIDVWETIALANRHPRVNILSPGPGVGGHCIPVDPRFLSNANPLVTELIQSARRVNDRMPYQVVRRVMEMLSPERACWKVALLGAAYKADVDDARESPCERIDALLRERGCSTAIYDPLVRRFSRPLAPTLEEALKDADALVLVTNHREFAELDPASSAALMRSLNVIDTRNAFDMEPWRRSGFSCYTLGRPMTRRRIVAVA